MHYLPVAKPNIPQMANAAYFAVCRVGNVPMHYFQNMKVQLYPKTSFDNNEWIRWQIIKNISGQLYMYMKIRINKEYAQILNLYINVNDHHIYMVKKMTMPYI